MIPLTIEAELASPIVTIHPLLFDGILHYAAGAGLGLSAESGWADAPKGGWHNMLLPLARIEIGNGLWWWAASAAQIHGPETRHYLHRRPAVEAMGRWTSAPSLNQGGGPDKALRIPKFRRIAMTSLRWSCVGDPVRIARLLAHVGGLGITSSHGHGWVVRWNVTLGGPDLVAYARDVQLRHLPADGRALGPNARRTRMPLTPPYHERSRAVACVQVSL